MSRRDLSAMRLSGSAAAREGHQETPRSVAAKSTTTGSRDSYTAHSVRAKGGDCDRHKKAGKPEPPEDSWSVHRPQSELSRLRGGGEKMIRWPLWSSSPARVAASGAPYAPLSL